MRAFFTSRREERRSVSCGPLAEAPAVIILTNAALAVWFGGFLPSAAAWAAALALTAALAFFTIRKFPAGLAPVMSVVFVTAALCSCICLWQMNKEGLFPDSFQCEAKVLLSRGWGKRTALLLDTPFGRAAAYTAHKGAPEAGSRVYIRASSFALKRADAPGAFSERSYWRARGASRRLALFEAKPICGPTGIAAWRGYVASVFKTKLQPLTCAYMTALTVGEKDDAVNKLHKSAGTSHLLAISGFHVGILAALLFYLFGKKAWGAAAVSAAMWLYVLAAGAPAGAVRAALMTQLAIAALLMDRPASAFNGVCCAGIAMLLWNPWYFYDVGWRLSMAAALFITAAAPYVPRNFTGAAVVSLLVWFVTAPVAAYAFGAVPLAGLLANIAAVPVFALLFPVIFILSLPALIGAPFAYVFSSAAELLLQAAHSLLSIAASAFPWAVGITAALAAFGTAIFISAAAVRCRIKAEAAPFICAIFLLLLLYCPPML